MAKILLIDTSLDGHHEEYLVALHDACVLAGLEPVVLVPERCKRLAEDKQKVLPEIKAMKTLSWSRRFQAIVQCVAKEEGVSVVHYAYGDAFYRFFGLGIAKVPGVAVAVTFHQFRRSALRDLSLKRILSKIDVCIVHTDELASEARSLAAEKVSTVLYPSFHTTDKSSIECKTHFGVSAGSPCIAAVGGARWDKGLDILSNALVGIDEPWQLLIAGSEGDFTEEQIKSILGDKTSRAVFAMRYLSDEEVAMAISASEIICCPYRKVFNGASGPMTEGIAQMKTIVGPSHGSLGELLQSHHVGYSFEAEDAEDLQRALRSALETPVEYDLEAAEFANRLTRPRFIGDYAAIYRDSFTKLQAKGLH